MMRLDGPFVMALDLPPNPPNLSRSFVRLGGMGLVSGLFSRSGLAWDMANRGAPKGLRPVINDLHCGPGDQQQTPDAARERARGLRPSTLPP